MKWSTGTTLREAASGQSGKRIGRWASQVGLGVAQVKTETRRQRRQKHTTAPQKKTQKTMKRRWFDRRLSSRRIDPPRRATTAAGAARSFSQDDTSFACCCGCCCCRCCYGDFKGRTASVGTVCWRVLNAAQRKQEKRGPRPPPSPGVLYKQRQADDNRRNCATDIKGAAPRRSWRTREREEVKNEGIAAPSPPLATDPLVDAAAK